MKLGQDFAAWRAEVDVLQAQLKSVFDMLQDQGHALAMEAQERYQLARLLQAEREDRARDVQELREALEAEREARARDREELAGSLQGEVGSRTSDVRELAKSLQAECNARAGEVAQLAKVFQTEREARVLEAEELADALRSEFAIADPAPRHPGDGLTKASPVGDGDCSQAATARRLEAAELAQRLNELTEFVMADREANIRAMEELRRSQRIGGGVPAAAA